VPSAVTDGRKVVKPVARPASRTGTGTTTMTKIGMMKLAPGRAGPTRVQIDIAEAATVGPGWRR